MTADGTPTEKPEITLESLQERLAINPFHQWLGLELVRVQDGLADAALALWGEGRDGRYIVLTGGEPMLQVDDALVDALHARGFAIAIESNGTLPAHPGLDWVCISPKAGSEVVQRSGHELKANGRTSCRERMGQYM